MTLLIVGVTVVALAVATAILAPAPGASADAPSWSEVQAAKKSASAKAAEVAKIRSLLSGLQAKAAELGQKAVKAAADAAQAEASLRAAARQAASLDTETAAAAKKAKAAKRQAGAVTSQLYRGGDPTLELWLSGSSSGALLYRLGALAKLDGASASLMQDALVAERTASSLGDQAKVAKAVRDRLAAKANRLADSAKAAQDAADAQVAATQRERATLESQLAALNANYSSLKSEYAAAQLAKERAAENGASSGSGGGSLGNISPGPNSLSPSGAQSYASGRLSAYGWGSGQMSCLISLWNIESGWRWNAYNASSGAYGIPQSLPGSKMASAGGDWTTSSKTQIEWGLGYIQSRYGSPCAAYDFETSHVPYWY